MFSYGTIVKAKSTEGVTGGEVGETGKVEEATDGTLKIKKDDGSEMTGPEASFEAVEAPEGTAEAPAPEAEEKKEEAEAEKTEEKTEEAAPEAPAATEEAPAAETPAEPTETAPEAAPTEEAPAPATEETPAPEPTAEATEEAAAPATEEAPAPATEEAPAPATEEAPPATEEAPAPATEEAPAPTEEAAAPATEEAAPAAESQEAPAPETEAAPAESAEVSAPAVEAPPTTAPTVTPVKYKAGSFVKVVSSDGISAGEVGQKGTVLPEADGEASGTLTVYSGGSVVTSPSADPTLSGGTKITGPATSFAPAVRALSKVSVKSMDGITGGDGDCVGKSGTVQGDSDDSDMVTVLLDSSEKGQPPSVTITGPISSFNVLGYYLQQLVWYKSKTAQKYLLTRVKGINAAGEIEIVVKDKVFLNAEELADKIKIQDKDE